MKMPDLQFTDVKMKIGAFEVIPLPTGIFGLDGGAMFGTVPKVLWEKSNPPDEKNRIPMEARALLLKSPGCNVIVDTGNGGDFIDKYGEKLGTKFASLYNISDAGPSLLKSLAAAGLEPDQIHHVILTHLHFDHAGGGTRAVGGKLVPTFAKAKYYVQKRNLETARAPNLREKASYFSANFEPLLQSGVLELLDGPRENLLPGISLFVSDGHTQGQQIVRVSDGHQSLVYGADVVPTASHVRTAWLMGYDLNPVLLMEEKQKYLGQAADASSAIFLEHDPYCDAVRIERQAGDFAVTERLRLT